jgi:hypothetical protein
MLFSPFRRKLFLFLEPCLGFKSVHPRVSRNKKTALPKDPAGKIGPSQTPQVHGNRKARPENALLKEKRK